MSVSQCSVEALRPAHARILFTTIVNVAIALIVAIFPDKNALRPSEPSLAILLHATVSLPRLLKAVMSSLSANTAVRD